MNIILLSIILLLFIYKVSGLYFTLPILMSMFNVIITSLKLLSEPDNMILDIIRKISISIIIIIIIINIIILVSIII